MNILNNRSTHDDITYASIAKAFQLTQVLHEPTLQKMKLITEKRLLAEHLSTGQTADSFKNTFEITEARKRMALLPFGNNTKVIFPADHLWVPLVIVNKNVHILPGILTLLV